MCKASKYLHILSVLKCAGLSDQDLMCVYFMLVRSVLEYCCVTWSNKLITFLSTSVRKRENTETCCALIFQNVHYGDALVMAICQQLDDRRLEFCMRMLDKIHCPNSPLHHLLFVWIVIHMSYKIIEIFAYQGVEWTDIGP